MIKISRTIAAILFITFLIVLIIALNEGCLAFALTRPIVNSISQLTNNTFFIGGPISGLIFSDTSFSTNLVPPDIISGYWQLNVKGGHVMYFLANFSMVNISGYPFHIIQLINFRTANNTTVQLDVNGSISRIHGTADIKLDEHARWNDINVDVLIHRLRSIIILLPPISEQQGGNDLFRAKPITGLVHFFLDKNGEHISSLPTFRIPYN